MESFKYSVNALSKMAALIVYRSQRRKMAEKAIFELSIISLKTKLNLRNKLLFNMFSKQNKNCDSPAKQRAERLKIGG